MKSNTHKTGQGQEPLFWFHDPVFLVDTERDARVAREVFGWKSIEFDLFLDVIDSRTWNSNVPLIVVSASDAFGAAKIVIEFYGRRISVRFVDLEGRSLEFMAKHPSTRFRLDRLISNPWHMTMTWGTC